MGRDKAWIEIEGRPLIIHVLERLRQVSREIIIVANDQEPYRKLETKVIGDTFPGKGSLGGIYSGLSAAQFDLAIAVACDMPFLNIALLGYMLTLSSDSDVVIPSAHGMHSSVRTSRDELKPGKANHTTAKDGDLHPLHAVYSKRCLEAIAARLAADDLRMISFHSQVRVRVVNNTELERYDPKHLSLFNVNTPNDLIIAESLALEETAGSND